MNQNEFIYYASMTMKFLSWVKLLFILSMYVHVIRMRMEEIPVAILKMSLHSQLNLNLNPSIMQKGLHFKIIIQR